MMTFTEHLRKVSFFLFLKVPYYHDWTSNFVSKINSYLSMNKGKNHQESKNSELHIFKTQTLCRVERNSERKKTLFLGQMSRLGFVYKTRISYEWQAERRYMFSLEGRKNIVNFVRSRLSKSLWGQRSPFCSLSILIYAYRSSTVYTCFIPILHYRWSK